MNTHIPSTREEALYFDFKQNKEIIDFIGTDLLKKLCNKIEAQWDIVPNYKDKQFMIETLKFHMRKELPTVAAALRGEVQ